MFRVKICGVTTPDDADACVEAGADAIGLNFYSPSPRYVPRDVARTIASTIPPTVTKVGVFVNATPDEVLETCDKVGLDAVQLHGDESPQMVRRLAARRLIKAFRCDRPVLEQVTQYLLACAALAGRLEAVLIDACRSGSYGGTGQVAEWSLVRELRALPISVPVILAGGLRPDNVVAAIEATRPAAVDTASGVEFSPGRKDPARVRAFVRNARDAFEFVASQDRGQTRMPPAFGPN